MILTIFLENLWVLNGVITISKHISYQVKGQSVSKSSAEFDFENRNNPGKCLSCEKTVYRIAGRLWTVDIFDVCSFFPHTHHFRQILVYFKKLSPTIASNLQFLLLKVRNFRETVWSEKWEKLGNL